LLSSLIVAISGCGDYLGDQSGESQHETDALLLVEGLPDGHGVLLEWWVEKAQLLHGCPPAMWAATQHL
jgi:hypothetical protein